jgi:alpha-L-rhamnosidase
MKQFTFSLAIMLLTITAAAQELVVRELTCDHKNNPVGIDNRKPRLSWKIYGSGNSIMQTSYSIRVSTDKKFSSDKIVWQTDKVESDESILRPYSGKDLKS